MGNDSLYSVYYGSAVNPIIIQDYTDHEIVVSDGKYFTPDDGLKFSCPDSGPLEVLDLYFRKSDKRTV